MEIKIDSNDLNRRRRRNWIRQWTLGMLQRQYSVRGACA